MKADPAAMRRARAAALQMLYQWEVGRLSPEEVVATYWPLHDADDEVPGELREFAERLVTGTIGRLGDIDALVSSRAHNWRLERMAILDRAVLRLAVYELLTAPGTPAKVVINEALELARAYSGEEAVAFVNGVLDAVRKDLNRS